MRVLYHTPAHYGVGVRVSGINGIGVRVGVAMSVAGDAPGVAVTAGAIVSVTPGDGDAVPGCVAEGEGVAIVGCVAEGDGVDGVAGMMAGFWVGGWRVGISVGGTLVGGAWVAAVVGCGSAGARFAGPGASTDGYVTKRVTATSPAKSAVASVAPNQFIRRGTDSRCDGGAG